MSNYRFDEDFDFFLEDFGEPHDCEAVPDSIIEAYRHKLPEQLFIYWREIGVCGFRGGMFWMVNSDVYQGLLDSWLEDTRFEHRDDLSVIARTAFGVLYVWSHGKGVVMKIHPSSNLISYLTENDTTQLADEKENAKMRQFWAFTDFEDVDETDEAEKPLFDRVHRRLGPLKSDEMYGFKHRLALGGKEAVGNLAIMKLEVYHGVAQQMELPEIISIG